MTPVLQELIVQAFATVARPVMLRYLGGDRQTCIASTRLTIETMKALGLAAVPVPVEFAAQCKALQYAFISGFSAEDRERMARQTGKPVIHRSVPGGGWNGHLLAAVEGRWLIDSSFDQIQALEFGLKVEPCIVVLPMPEGTEVKELLAEVKGETENGDTLDIHYRSIEDYSFRDSEAWEFCLGMKYATRQIVRAVTQAFRFNEREMGRKPN